MSSYTSTSNHPKLLISLFMIAFIMSIVCVDLFLEYYASSKTTANSYITEKDSKLKHAQLLNPINKQAIFIGSSRTYYHVSTNELNSNSLDIYNMGVSNSSLQGFPSFVREALKYKPQSIVLSIEVNELFRQLPISDYPKFIDLSSYYHSLNSTYLANSTVSWIQNFHSLLRYSESIYLKIISFYNKFNPPNTEPDVIKTALINLDQISDCSIFSKKQTENFITSKCKNGDGILFGHYKKESQTKKIKLQNINLETVAFINHLINTINSENIIPIVILEPVNQFDTEYQYDIKQIKKKIDTVLIDLTQLQTQLDFWVDSRHFNNQGRLFYSNKIITLLKKIINE